MQNIRRIENKNGSVSWQIDYTIKELMDKKTDRIIRPAKRVRKSFPTKKAAKLALSNFNVTMAKGTYDNPEKYEHVRLDDLIDRYERVYKKQRSYEISKRFFIERIRSYFKGSRLLKTITYADLQEFQQHLIKSNRHKHSRSDKPDRKLTPATVNRITATLRHMLTCAQEQWDIMAVNPFKDKPSLQLTENNEQDRYLTQDEIKRLLAVSPQHLQDAIIAAINSGMRRTELLTLTWQQIKWDDGYIELPVTKTGKTQHVTLNEPLITLFKSIRSRPVVDSKYVFIWQDWTGHWTPVRSVKTAFKTACKAAGIKYGRPDHVTFHTLRHSYGSHLVMRGASIYEVCDLMRHASVTMTQRYAHLDDKTKQAAAARLNGLTG